MTLPRLALLLTLVAAGCAGPRAAAPSLPQAPRPAGLSAQDAAFLDDVQHRTFRWFWETTNPQNGLVPDRHPNVTFSSVASVGFGLTAYPVGVERGWITRDQAVARTLTTLRFFWNAPQGPARRGMTGHKGFFYHFLDMNTGERFQNVELSSIDTGLFLYGALAAAQYFDRSTPEEAEIRDLADRLYRRVDWRWFQPWGPLLSMGWHPEEGFNSYEYRGMSEAAFLYVLALGSPTHPIHESAWPAFTASYHWAPFEGYEQINFAPLFGHQYTHVWLDLKGVPDAYTRSKGLDYFENSRRASLSQVAYATRNPMGWKGYGADLWGLSACDGPTDTTMVVQKADGTLSERRTFQTYSARGAAAGEIRDDGTICPTAAGSSIPFTPQESIRALRTMATRYGADLFTPRYGFLDAFNPTLTDARLHVRAGRIVPGKAWVDTDYLGIDQGPLLLMMENYRTGFVWNLMHGSEPLIRGLRRAGFTGGWLDRAPQVPSVTAPLPDGPRAGTTRIVVLGSSTAAGWGPRDRGNGWVNRFRDYALRQDSLTEVLNLAIGGYTTFQLLPTGTALREGRVPVDTLRNITRALNLKPDAIVVGLGSNDRAYGYTNAEQLANFETMRRMAEAQNVPIFFTTTQPRSIAGTGIADQMAVRDSLTARYPGRVIDVWTFIATPEGVLEPRWDSGDHLHLNDAGHAILFERVRDAGVLEAARAHRAARGGR